jgi:FkbM family methyltransferase
VNWLGVRSPADFFAGQPRLAGASLRSIPDPDDGIHASWAEYAALLYAIETAGDTLTVAELGAAWGPWVSAAGVVGRRLGRFKHIDLVAMEASSRKHARLKAHLSENGLLDGIGLRVRTICGAAWSRNETLRFPDDEGLAVDDIGAAAGMSDRDIRGGQKRMRDVPAFGFDTLFSHVGVIDYMHFDVQGAEELIIPDWLERLCEKVRVMLVGTHARHIQEALIETLSAAGWRLTHAEPCVYTVNPGCSSAAGMTTRDGE